MFGREKVGFERKVRSRASWTLDVWEEMYDRFVQSIPTRKPNPETRRQAG
jgi:hypothetical protein